MAKTPSNDSTPRRPEKRSTARKAYQAPQIFEWGSVLDLTQGPKSGGQDGGFEGSDPFFK